MLYGNAQYADAITEYRKSIGLDPANAAAHNYLAMSLLSLGRSQEAEPESREAVRLEPGNALWQDGLGIVLTDLSRYTEAERPAREAARLSPDDERIRKNLDRLLAKKNEPSSGPVTFTTAVPHNQN